MWLVTSLLTSVNVTTVIVFFLVFLVVYYWLVTPSNLPPGPPGLPVVGNLFSINPNDIVAQMKKLHEQYGDVFTIRLGTKYMIVINSYKLAYETFVKNADVFSGRPVNLHSVQQVILATGTGVVLSVGPRWKALRRVTLMTMRDFGVGKKTLEQRVNEEARAVMEVIDKSQGQPMTLKPLLSKFTCNVICSVILGNRFDYLDPTFVQLTGMVAETVRQPLIFTAANFVSLTRFLPSVKKTLQTITGTFVTVDKYLEKILKEHIETYEPSEIRDFVDLYIKTGQEGEDAHIYDAANMRRVIIDLFVAGTETTSTTVDWLILYLIAHPDVQERCQKCVDEFVGQHRPVTMEDKKNLSYIEAVITETLRVNTIAPLGVPHLAEKKGKINGYTIPANSIVVANISEMHLNPDVWSDPYVFRPERFLDQDGKFCHPKENFLPFSIGPRVCLGEVLARMEVFILFTTLVQNFTFRSVQGQQPDLEGLMGIVTTAKLQPIVAKRR